MHWNIQTQDFQVKKTYMTSIIYTQDILMKQVYKVDMWLFTKQNGFQCFFVMTAQPLCCYKWRNWSGRKKNQPSPLRCFLYFVAYVYSSLLFISWNPLTELMVAEGAELERNQMACDFHCSHTVSEESHELLLPQLLTLFPLGPVLEVSYHWTQGGGGSILLFEFHSNSRLNECILVCGAQIPVQADKEQWQSSTGTSRPDEARFWQRDVPVSKLLHQ